MVIIYEMAKISSFLDRFKDFLNTSLILIKCKQRIMPKEDMVKINLGSALVVAKGWINVDSSLNAFFSGFPRPLIGLLYYFSGSKKIYSKQEYINILKSSTFIHHNLQYGIPFPDGSADYIYTSHFLEHFSKDDAETFLKECLRVLTKNGRIRICVPDLEYVVSVYLEGKKDRALDYFYTNSLTKNFNDHRYMYDFDLLKKSLSKTGFSLIEKCAYKQGHMPDIDKLDQKPEETLFVEAVKQSEKAYEYPGH